MLYLGLPDAPARYLGDSHDKTLRTLIIHRLAPAGVAPDEIVDWLGQEPDPYVSAALILGLGEYTSDRFLRGQREAIVPSLLQSFRDDPHPGVHSGPLDWLLRKWGQAGPLKEIDGAVSSRDPDNNRDWYVNRQGQTLAVLRGPLTFSMGSPDDEADRTSIERLHQRSIPRTFAISTKEVTVEEFLRLRQQDYNEKYSPEPNCPMIHIFSGTTRSAIAVF